MNLYDVIFDGNILFFCGERILNSFSKFHALSLRFNLVTYSFDTYMSAYRASTKRAILYGNAVIGSKYIAIGVEQTSP